jgi:CopG antitoxin of type II toxin-antitoxin system
MKKRIKPKSKIPKFNSEREAAEFFDTHSADQHWDELVPARPIQLPPEQVREIRKRAAHRRKAAISIRLDPAQIETAKKIAARKSIGYQTQLRLWIADGIQRETKKKARHLPRR